MYWSQLYSLVSATVLVATAVFALPQQQPPAHTPQLTLTNSAGTPPTPTPPPPPPPSPLTAPIAGNIPFPPPGSTAIQPMPLPNNCFILANSQECPAFNGLTINSNVKFTDSASFDNYLRTTSFSSNAALLQRFRTQHQCPTFSPDAQQYSQSMRCFNLVQQGQHACSPTRTAPRLVCRDVCIKHLDSLSRAFANPQLCDTSNISPAAEKARRDTVEKARNLCERMVGRSIGLDSPPSDCIPPLPFEQVQCGFINSQAGQDFCTSSPSKPCCRTLGQQTPPMPSGFPPGTFGTPPNATSNARTGSSGERGAQSANDSQSSSSTAAASSPPVAAIVISVIAVLTVIGGVGGYFGYKKFYPQQRSKIVSNLEAATAERAGGGDSVDPNMPQLTESAYAIGGGDGMGGEGMMMDEDALNIDMECVADYVPNLDDELALKVGDIITVTEIFEDDWAYGLNQSTEMMGTFPLSHCREGLETEVGNPRVGRESSFIN